VRTEAAWREEWKVLHDRRELARRRWRGAVAGLSERARDPLGLGALVREHPLASAGIGAAAGALLGGFLLRGARAQGKDDAAASATPPAPWKILLRDAAMGIAVPWLLRMVREKFGGDGVADPGAPPPCRPPDRDQVPSPTQEVSP
jgi:hypothetical protein